MESEYGALIDEDSNQTYPSQSNQYDDIVNETYLPSKQKFVGSQNVAQTLEPTRVSEATKIARQIKMPVAFVERNLETFKEKRRDPSLDYQVLVDEAPETAKFQQDPYKAAATNNDTKSLALSEKTLKRIKPYVDKPGYLSDLGTASKTGVDTLKVSTYHLGAAYGVVDINDYADEIAATNKTIRDSATKAPAYAQEFNEAMAREGKDVDRAFSRFKGSFKSFKEKRILEGLANFTVGGLATVGETVDQLGAAVVRPKGALRSTAESLAFSAPSLATGAAGAGAGFLAGGPIGSAIGMGVGTFSGGVAPEVGIWINQALEERGYDITSADDLRRAYSNKKLMTEIRGEAQRKGVTTASVDALFSLVGGKIVKGAKGAKGLAKAKAVAKDVGVQAVGEGAGEFAGQAAARKGDLSKVSIGDAITEGIVSMGQSAGTTAIGATVGKTKEAATKIRSEFSVSPIDAAEEVADQVTNAQESLSELQAVEQLESIVAQSEVQSNDPELMAEFIETVNADAGQQSVFYQSDEFDEFWRERGESPVAKAEELLGSTEAYDDAKKTGQPIEVPLSGMVTKMAGTPEFQEIMAITRTKPNGLTVDESKLVLQNVPQVMEQIAEEAQKELEFRDQVEVEAKELRETIEDQLKAVGRNPIEAVPIEAMLKTLAIKENVPVSEIAKKFDLKVRKDSKATKAKILSQQKRGRLLVNKNNKFTIEFLEGADKSTFVHESGHYFLEVLNGMSSRKEATTELKEDFKAILDWLEVDSADKIETEHHEKWARGFEAYLREGNAPSKKLRKAFNTFKVWLTQIYRSAMQLDVKLTDDIRDVMDRMLATEEEIADAHKSTGDIPLFGFPVEQGMTAPQANRYNELIEESDLKAKEALMNKLMRDKIRKEKIDRPAIVKETADEVNEIRVYNTISILKRGKMADGSAMPEGSFKLKINPREFALRYPEYAGNENFKGTFSKKDATSLDLITSILNYDSIDMMMAEIANAPDKNDHIKFITDAKIQEISQDLLNKEEISEEAERLVHNESRAKRLRMEYDHIASSSPALLRDVTKRVTMRPISQKDIKIYAAKVINEQKVGEIKPNTYRLAERKFAKEAGKALAAKDIEGAFQAKQKELINFELYKLATEAKTKVKKDNTLIKRIFKKDDKLAKTRDMDLVGAARAILSRYGLGNSKKDPLQHLAKIKEYDPESYEMIAGIVSGVMDAPDVYTNVPYGQYRDMIDSVGAIWDLAKEAKEIEVGGKKVSVAEANAKLISEMQKFKKPKAKKKYDETATDWEKMKEDLLGVKAMVRRFEHWVDVMDLGNISGPFRTFLFKATSDASDKFLEERKKYKERFVKLSEEHKKTMDLTAAIEADEIGFKFKNKSELLGALLHTGNEGNLRKLLVGRGWAIIDEDGNMDTSKWDSFIQRMWDQGVLTKADYDYIQELWNLMEDLKPGAQKAHKKIFGFYFDEITANEVVTPFGTYRGGYAPAVVDPTAVRDIARKQELDEFIKGHSSFTYPASGGRGFTKGRVEAFNKPLNIDLGLVGKHIESVLRFSIIKPAVVDAAKVIMSQDFKENMNAIDPNVIEKMIKPALNRADKNTIQTTDPSGSRMIKQVNNMLQRNASMQLMFANVVNTMEQVGGLGISATRIKPKYLARSMYRYMMNPAKLSKAVNEKSSAMRGRTDEQMFEIEKRSRNIFSEESNLQKMRTFATQHTYFLQAFTQNIVDTITWAAGYDESIAEGKTDEQAVAKADADVRMTQSSRRPMDISNLETNTTLRFFQMFMNFFNMMANINASNFTKLYYEDMGMKKKFAKGLYLYATGFATVAVISAALRKAAAGGLDEDEDGEYTDDLFDVFIGSQKDLALAMIPVAGPAVNAGINQANDKFYDDRVSASPAVSAITAVAGTVSKAATGKLTDDKGVSGDVRDSLTALGIVTGLPLRPLSKPINYSIDMQTGRAKPKGPVDLIRGVVTGKPGVR